MGSFPRVESRGDFDVILNGEPGVSPSNYYCPGGLNFTPAAG